MHPSEPQQVRRRNFDLEQYDGSCCQSFPFVKWIDSTIDAMGAMSSQPSKSPMLRYLPRQPTNHAKLKPRKHSRELTKDGNRGRSIGTSTQSPQDSWTLKIYKRSWPKKNGSESSRSNQSLPLQSPSSLNMEKEIYKQQKIAGQVLVAIKNR